MTDRLTPREIECVRLAGQRFRDAEIGQRLGISQGTVSNHLQRAYDKLGVRDRIRAAERLGILYTVHEMPMARAAHIGSGGAADIVVSPTEPAGTAPPSAQERQWSFPRPRLQLPPVPDSRRRRIEWVARFFVLLSLLTVVGISLVNTSQTLVDRQAPARVR